MNHVAFAVPPEKIDEYRDRLRAAGVDCTDVANHDDSEWGIADEVHPGCLRAVGLLPGPRRHPAGVRLLDPGAGPRRRRPCAGTGRRSGQGLRGVTRLRQVPRDGAGAPIVTVMYDLLFEGRDPVAARHLGRQAGRLVDGVRPRARRPRAAVQGSASTRARRGLLDPVLRELAQARVGWAWAANSSTPSTASRCGACRCPRRRSPRCPDWAVADCFSPVERLVLAYTDCLAFDHGRVPTGSSTHSAGAVRRGDPGTHLHHHPLPAARGHVAGPAHRVRRPARTRGRGGHRGRQHRRRPTRPPAAAPRLTPPGRPGGVR